MNDTSLNSAKLLDSEVVEERLQGVRLLADMAPVRMESFCRAFGDDDWRVRKEAVRIFLAVPNVQSFSKQVIGLLHDSENAGLRNSSIEILVGLGTLAVADLTAEIGSPDPEVRKFVIDILGEIGVSGCEEGVLNALSDEDINVRYAAVETLGKMKVDKAVDPLLDLMDDADTGLRFTILEALASIGKNVSVERLSRYLDDRVLRKALIDCLGKIGSADVLPCLVEGLTDPMRKVRASSLGSLGRIVLDRPQDVRAVLQQAPENIEAHLIAMLNDPDVATQKNALRLAATVGGEAVAKALLPLLENELLRSDVVEAFRSQDEQFFAQLLPQDVETDPMVRLFLIYLAGELQSRKGIRLAVESLESSDPQLRYTATIALGRIGHAQAIVPLAARLKDENGDISDSAATALELLAPEYGDDIAQAVAPLLNSQDSVLRMRAVRVLGSLTGAKVEPALLMAIKDPDAEVRSEAIKALRGSGAEGYVEGLMLALNDEVDGVRRLAADALGTCDGDQPLQALALALEDHDPWVRAAAVRSLRRFEADMVSALLEQAARDSIGLVVIAALETMRERSFAAARPVLEDALKHSDEEVVKAAIDLLARENNCDYLLPFSSDLLHHPQRDVRIHAIQTLDRICGPACKQQLEQRLSVEDDQMVHQMIEETLHRLQRFGG